MLIILLGRYPPFPLVPCIIFKPTWQVSELHTLKVRVLSPKLFSMLTKNLMPLSFCNLLLVLENYAVIDLGAST